MDKNIVSPFFLTHGVYMVDTLKYFSAVCNNCLKAASVNWVIFSAR